MHLTVFLQLLGAQGELIAVDQCLCPEKAQKLTLSLLVPLATIVFFPRDIRAESS